MAQEELAAYREVQRKLDKYEKSVAQMSRERKAFEEAERQRKIAEFSARKMKERQEAAVRTIQSTWRAFQGKITFQFLSPCDRTSMKFTMTQADRAHYSVLICREQCFLLNIFFFVHTELKRKKAKKAAKGKKK